MTYLSLPLEVEDGERTDIPDPIDVHRKLSEEVHDGGRRAGQGEDENEGGQQNRDEFLQKIRQFHLEKLGEFGMDLEHAKLLASGISVQLETSTYRLRMQLIAPFVGQVMRMRHHFGNELLGREDFSILGNHSSRYRQYGGEETQVEQNGPILRDLKMKKDGIDH